MLDVRVKEGINTATRHLGLDDFIKGHAQSSGSGALTENVRGSLMNREGEWPGWDEACSRGHGWYY